MGATSASSIAPSRARRRPTDAAPCRRPLASVRLAEALHGACLRRFPSPPPPPANTRGRVILASLIGTSIEFYDFYVYATAAVLVFPSLFFTNEDPTTALLASFAVFGVAFIARPIGSIVFGHFGDRIGRKGTLVGSLLTMGIATVLIGCLPTAQVPGWEFWAPFLLVVMRFCQGLGLGGEWSGAALLATENRGLWRHVTHLPGAAIAARHAVVGARDLRDPWRGSWDSARSSRCVMVSNSCASSGY